MAVIQDVARSANQNGRVAGSFRDGQQTRYVEVIGDHIVICASDLNTNGDPEVIHVNYDLLGRNFVPRSITTQRSGFDGKLLVTLGGYTPDSDNSRRITIKCDLVIEKEV
jgi:hypothetical protein